MTPERAVIETMFMIPDKRTGADLPFILNSAQRQIDNNLTDRNVVPKGRQEGVSAYFLARFTVKCLSRKNTKAVVISHDKESTERLLNRVKYYLNNLRGPAAVIKHNSANEISFPKTNSVFYIGTAGSRKFGRGDTIDFLHCSEMAYWSNPVELVGGLFQAAKYGEIDVESTGNGQGDYYHKLCVRANEGHSRFRIHFLPWHTFMQSQNSYVEYSSPVTLEESSYIMANLDEVIEEPEIVKKYGVTAGQLKWRRETLEELDYDLTRFKQEYPFTLDECFQASGNSVFTKINYKETSEWKKIDRFLHKLGDHPKPGLQYLASADVSAGVRKDNSIIEIICLNTMEQVGEWASDAIDPLAFGDKVAEMGRYFNNAYLAVESNNHGILTLKRITELYDSPLIYKTNVRSRVNDEVGKLTDLGVRTTARTKPYIVGKLRVALMSDLLIHSYALKSELDSFVEHEDGTMSAQQGCFDDRVMALGVGIYALERAIVMTDVKPRMIKADPTANPFSLEALMEECRARHEFGASGYPIPSQTGGPFTW